MPAPISSGSTPIPVPTSGQGTGRLTGYRWSGNVLAKVTDEFGIQAPVQLLREATKLDDGNKYLNRSELTSAAQRVQAMALSGYRWSPRVLQSVMSQAGLSDAKAVLDAAKAIDDGNGYLNRSELTQAASQVAADHFTGFSYSNNVLNSVMEDYGLSDSTGLLAEAKKHDNGNKYLNRKELTAAAEAITAGVPEIGYVSDLDKTIIPPHDTSSSAHLPAKPYPGVKTLLHEIEFKGSGLGGDAHYVTARTPDRLDGVPEWLASHGVPDGAIDSGVSGVPWLAQKEKIKDISAIFDANPDQKFVLLGDSSHRDPEVFQAIKAKYPGRVQAAFVHKVNNVNPTRVAGLDLITNYTQAAATLLSRGVIDEAAARRVMVAAKNEGVEITNAEIDDLISAHLPE